MPGPLAHPTVLDLVRVHAGPWCPQLFADLDAAVIKVEKSGTGDDGRFATFCAAADVPTWAQDPRCAKNADRVRHRATQVPMVAEEVARRAQRDWLRTLEGAGVPCGPVDRLDAVSADPQVAARARRRARATVTARGDAQ